MNHNGNVNLAKKLIKQAKLCGADFVKFQNWKAESLVTKNARNPIQKKNTKKKFKQVDLLRPLELKEKDYLNFINLQKNEN